MEDKKVRIVIILLIFMFSGLICGILSTIITKNTGDLVEVKITDLQDYDDANYISHHVVFGEIVTKGENKGKKVRFETALDNNYKVGDIVKGKYRDGDFVLEE